MPLLVSVGMALLVMLGSAVLPPSRPASAVEQVLGTAISTGAWDAMECVLLKMGIEASEFTPPGGGGRIEVYKGNGVDDGIFTPSESTLTETLSGPTRLDRYDQVLLPCWGQDPRPGSYDYSANNVKTARGKSNMLQYVNHGGRVFATHFSYSWLFDNPPLSGTATWVSDSEPGDPAREPANRVGRR